MLTTIAGLIVLAVVIALAIAAFVPVLRIVLSLVSLLLMITLPILFLIDIANGGPVTEALVEWLIVLFGALYAGVVKLTGGR